jgi:Tfp pilus assembly protein PilN
VSVLVNLLPDIRLQRQRDKDRRQLITGISLVAMIVCGAFLVLMFVLTSGQSILINNVKNDNATKKTDLTNTQGLIPALSAQARLNSLSTLYAQRTVVTKLMAALNEVSPSTMQITSLKYSSLDGSLAIAGSVQSYAEAAKLSKALESAHVTIGTGSPSTAPYFTDVKLLSASRSSNNSVDFSITTTVTLGAINGN